MRVKISGKYFYSYYMLPSMLHEDFERILGSGMGQQGDEEERANNLESVLSAGPHTAQRREEANLHQR